MTLNLLQYYNNREQRTRRYEEQTQFKEKKREEMRKVRNRFRDKKWELEAQEREQTNKIEAQIEKREEQKQEQVAKLNVLIDKVERVLELVRISKNKIDLDFKVYHYVEKRTKEGCYLWDENGNIEKDEVCFKPVDVLADDEFKKVAVFVVPNGKPVNEFSLIVRGVSIFASSDKLKLRLKMSRYEGYLSGVHEDRSNVSVTLKSLPSEKALLGWYKKSKHKKVKEFLAKHEETEKEYGEAVEYYKTEEWKIAYLKNRKRYYEKCYHRAEERTEYQQIIKDLAKLGVEA